MNETSTFYTEIINRLDRVRRKENRLALVYGVMVALLVSVAAVLLAMVLERIFFFDTLGRTILFAATAAGVAGAIGWFVIRPLLYVIGVLKSADNHTLALKVGKHFPGIRDRLLDALEMYEGRKALRQHYSLALIDASFTDLYRQIQPLDFAEAVSNARVQRMRKLTAYSFALFLLVFVVSPSGFFSSFHRIVNFGTSFATLLPIQFIVEPGNAEVVRGETVPITIRTQGQPMTRQSEWRVKELSLLTRQQGQIDFDTQNLKAGNDGTFKTELPNIKLTTDYYAAVDDIISDKFRITVLDRPLIRSLRLKITSPGYTRIPPRTLDENMGDVSAYPGSRVDVKVASSKDLSSATVVFSAKQMVDDSLRDRRSTRRSDQTDSMVLRLSTAGAEATGSFSISPNRWWTSRMNATYHVLLKDKDGLPNIDPVEYSIKVTPDEYPTAEILAPARNVDLTEEMKLDLFIRIKDDFGFSGLRLAYRLVHSRYERPAEEFTLVDIPIEQKQQTQVDQWYHWDLSEMHLVPEDALAYYVEVLDNDNVNGPKSGRSETYVVRLPSLEEVFADVSESHSQSLESMRSVAQETQQLKKDIDDLSRELKKNRGDKMDWQQQKKAEEMLQRYETMKKKLEEVSKRLDETVQKMDENKLLSPQTMEKYQELQKLMEQLNSPELQEALKKLQESMKQLSPEQMKQAMEQLKFSEDQFRQSLERTIELLKRIHIEQKLDELIKRTEELQKQQESLQQQTANTNPSDQQKRDELAQQQQDLQKRMDALQKETSDLKQKMEEFPKEMPTEEMAKAEQQLEQKQIGQQMQKSARQMQLGNMQGAQQSQQQTQQDLSEFMEQLQQTQQALRDKQMQQIVNEMRKQLQNVLELSKREESLKDETKSLDPNSQRFRENAQRQNDVLSDLGNVANQMAQLGKKTFAVSPEMGKEIGSAMRQMAEAMEQMEGRNPGGSSQKQSEAMGSLNRAAMMMQNALGAMMSGQGGMGMAGLMARMQQMAGQQAGINAGTQSAMGQGQGNMLTPQQQAEYGRLAAAQGAVQKSLEELSREAKNAGEYSRLLGDLDRIAQEMSEVQTDLEQGNVNPNTVQKQDRILSRLLESTRSMRERDYEKRRRADTGKNILRPSPADIDLTTQEGRNRLREELMKVIEGRYSKDYEQLIRRYFERLEKEEIKQLE